VQRGKKVASGHSGGVRGGKGWKDRNKMIRKRAREIAWAKKPWGDGVTEKSGVIGNREILRQEKTSGW